MSNDSESPDHIDNNVDESSLPNHREIKADHDKQGEITKAAGLPSLPCACYSCNTIRRADADAKFGPLVTPPPPDYSHRRLRARAKQSTPSNSPATVPKHPPAGAVAMSRPKKTTVKKSAGEKPAAQKAKPAAQASKKVAPAPAAAAVPSTVPGQRRVLKISRPTEAVMFRVTTEEMDAIIVEAEKSRDTSIAASIRRRLGLGRR